MAIDKSTWNRKVKVSQSTIDDIKRLGMTKALKLAKRNAGATQAGLVKEYQEATRRLYGDRRFAAATKGATPAPMKKGSYQAGSAKSGKATYTTGSGVKYKASGTPAAKPAAKPASKGMSGTTKRNLIGGALLAGGLLAAKATPAGRAVSAAAGLGRAASKLGTKSEYAAKAAEGKTRAALTAAAAKATAKKTAAAAPKKTGLSAGKRFDANAPKVKPPKKK
jgi:hypothetical protein